MKERRKKYDYGQFDSNQFVEAMTLALKDRNVIYARGADSDVFLIKTRLKDGRYAWTTPTPAEKEEYKKNREKAFKEKEDIPHK